MKKYSLVAILLLTSIFSEAQVIVIGDLVEKIGIYRLDTASKPTIAIVNKFNPNFFIVKGAPIKRDLNLIIFDRESFFVDFLKTQGEIYLLTINFIRLQENKLFVDLNIATTNYSAYTNPHGPVLGDVSEIEILFEKSKLNCEWIFKRKSVKR